MLYEASRDILKIMNDIETRHLGRSREVRGERKKRPKSYTSEWVDALEKGEISPTLDEAVKIADVGGQPLMTLMIPDHYTEDQRKTVIGLGHLIENGWDNSSYSEGITRLLTAATEEIGLDTDDPDLFQKLKTFVNEPPQSENPEDMVTEMEEAVVG